MLDFGMIELLFIVAVAILVIGPQDIPKIMYNLGRIVRRLQYVRFAMSRQFEDFMREHDMEELHKGVNFEAPVYDEAAADAEITFDSEEDTCGDEKEDQAPYE